MIASRAIGANDGLHLHSRRVPGGVRDRARRARGGPRAGLVGANVLGSRLEPHGRRPPRRRRLHLRRGDRPSRVARGQARPAALEAALPGRSPACTRQPTLINNVETLATVPKILEMAVEPTRSSASRTPPARVSSRSPATCNGGNYEVELGTCLRELIYDIGGGIPDGRELKAIIPGRLVGAGSHRRRNRYGARLRLHGGGGDDARLRRGHRDGRARCMVQLGLRVAQFYMHESCGKCTPCREGTRWMVRSLRKIEDGEASQAELDLLLNVCDRILGNCLCPLGDAAAMPVASYVAKFRDEYQRHIDEGGCPSMGTPLSTALWRRSTSITATHPRRSRCRREQPRARQGHRRRPRDRSPQGQGSDRDRARGRDRDTGLLLRAEARPAGRRLPHVPLRSRGHAEAPGRLHDDRPGRPRPSDRADEREGREGQAPSSSSSS